MADLERKPFKDWWLLMVSGILLLILGFFTLFTPETLSFLAMLYSIIVIISGIFSIYLFFRNSLYQDRFWFLINGIIDILFGILIFLLPGAFVIALALVVAIWVMVRGIMIFADSFRQLSLKIKGWWGDLIFGILLILFGIFLLCNLGLTILTMNILLGITVIVFAISLISLSLRLKAANKLLD